MARVKLHSIEIEYTDRGTDNGSPVIFIHGFPFSQRMWDNQAALLESTHRVITYDIRGHGMSDPGSGPYLIDFFVDDLFGLMDTLNINSAHIAGLSMGGYIALRGIEREPDRFTSLILCDTKSDADTNEAKLKRADAVRTIITKGTPVFAENFLKSVFAPETFETNPEAVKQIRDTIVATPPSVLCNTLVALAARTDTTDSLHAIKVPTLILVGKHDQLTPPAAAQSMANRIRNSEIHSIDRAGHLSNLENSEVFNKHLIKFLKM